MILPDLNHLTSTDLVLGIIAGFLAGSFFIGLYARLIWLPKKRKAFHALSKPVLAGQIQEQLAPYLPGFPYQPSEAKFIGKPVDFIVFQGLDTGCVDEIIFIEVKTGNHRRLTPAERSIRETIQEGRIRWYQYDFNP